MGVTYFEKAKPNNAICKKVISPPLHLLGSSSEQKCPVLVQICTVNNQKSDKCRRYKHSVTNKVDPISWSKVYTSPAVAKRRRHADIDEIGESDEVKSTLYSLDKISGTNTVMEGPKERGDYAAVETQTVVSSATLKLIEKRCILNRITLRKLRCLCCCRGSNDRAPSIHDADSFESIDITTPQSHQISTFNGTAYNIVQRDSRTTAQRTKFNIKVAQILKKVTLKKCRRTSKELLKSFKTFSYECNV